MIESISDISTTSLSPRPPPRISTARACEILRARTLAESVDASATTWDDVATGSRECSCRPRLRPISAKLERIAPIASLSRRSSSSDALSETRRSRCLSRASAHRSAGIWIHARASRGFVTPAPALPVSPSCFRGYPRSKPPDVRAPIREDSFNPISRTEWQSKSNNPFA